MIKIERMTKNVKVIAFYLLSIFFKKISIICIRISFVGLIIVVYDFVVEVKFILYFLDVNIFKDKISLD